MDRNVMTNFPDWLSDEVFPFRSKVSAINFSGVLSLGSTLYRGSSYRV